MLDFVLISVKALSFKALSFKVFDPVHCQWAICHRYVIKDCGGSLFAICPLGRLSSSFLVDMIDWKDGR